MAEKTIRTFKYRIYPNREQTERLIFALGLCCELYNAALQERRDAWKIERKSIAFFDQTSQLKDIRANRSEMSTVNAHVFEDVLRRVDLAFKSFFRRLRTGHKPGYPRFRSFRRYDSITFRQIGNALDGNRLRLSKIGSVRIKLHRPLVGEIKTLTVKREAGRWYALFVVANFPKTLPYSPNVIGVDRCGS